ncbi:MAG: hypothetical protein HQK53_09260 [Oligoflexia bacterium]|nr:hypothetical protein [Oligoflexia bacterium]
MRMFRSLIFFQLFFFIFYLNFIFYAWGGAGKSSVTSPCDGALPQVPSGEQCDSSSVNQISPAVNQLLYNLTQVRETVRLINADKGFLSNLFGKKTGKYADALTTDKSMCPNWNKFFLEGCKNATNRDKMCGLFPQGMESKQINDVLNKLIKKCTWLDGSVSDICLPTKDKNSVGQCIASKLHWSNPNQKTLDKLTDYYKKAEECVKGKGKEKYKNHICDPAIRNDGLEGAPLVHINLGLCDDKIGFDDLKQCGSRKNIPQNRVSILDSLVVQSSVLDESSNVCNGLKIYNDQRNRYHSRRADGDSDLLYKTMRDAAKAAMDSAKMDFAQYFQLPQLSKDSSYPDLKAEYAYLNLDITLVKKLNDLKSSRNENGVKELLEKCGSVWSFLRKHNASLDPQRNFQHSSGPIVSTVQRLKSIRKGGISDCDLEKLLPDPEVPEKLDEDVLRRCLLVLNKESDSVLRQQITDVMKESRKILNALTIKVGQGQVITEELSGLVAATKGAIDKIVELEAVKPLPDYLLALYEKAKALSSPPAGREVNLDELSSFKKEIDAVRETITRTENPDIKKNELVDALLSAMSSLQNVLVIKSPANAFRLRSGNLDIALAGKQLSDARDSLLAASLSEEDEATVKLLLQAQPRQNLR